MIQVTYTQTSICRIHFTPIQTTIHFINTYEERKAQEDKFGVKVGRKGKRNRKQRSKVTNRNRQLRNLSPQTDILLCSLSIPVSQKKKPVMCILWILSYFLLISINTAITVMIRFVILKSYVLLISSRCRWRYRHYLETVFCQLVSASICLLVLLPFIMDIIKSSYWLCLRHFRLQLFVL